MHLTTFLSLQELLELIGAVAVSLVTGRATSGESSKPFFLAAHGHNCKTVFG